MRRSIRSLPLISLIVLAALMAPAQPVRATAESGAVITVNTTNDEINGDGNCSLREAVYSANTNGAVDACTAGIGSDRIVLPEGLYQLSIPDPGPVPDEDALKGDLDIRESLVIEGAGQVASIIDGGNIDRVFHIIGATTTVEISRLTIQNGNAGAALYGGGGILNQGTLTLRGVSFLGNSTSAVGGAIDNLGKATLFDSSIVDNQAADGGGIFNGGDLFLSSSTLSGNTASTDPGGGLDNSGTGTLENVTISGNTGASGGGIFSDGELLTLLNSTIVGNSSIDTQKGGNIQSANEIRFINTLVANSLSGPNCSGSGFSSLGHNLDSGNTCNFSHDTDLRGTGDPLIGPLEDNQGPTLTHALLPGSPAIDTGDNSILTCPQKDQRGAYRPADGNGDYIKICDIGAFEYAGNFATYVYLAFIVR